MIFLGGARRIGKTTKMIEWLKENKHRTLLVHNQPYANQLKSDHPEVASQIDTFERYVNLKKGFWPQTKEIAIDNIDIIIQRWVNAPVKYVTFTGGVDFTNATLKQFTANYEEQQDPRFPV